MLLVLAFSMGLVPLVKPQLRRLQCPPWQKSPGKKSRQNRDHTDLKVLGQDGSVVQCKIKRHTPHSKLMKACCEQQGLSMRQIRSLFEGQPINETQPHSWKWRMEIQLMCSSNQWEVSAEEGDCSRTLPEDQETFSLGKLQLGSSTSWLRLLSLSPSPFHYCM